MRYLRGLIIGAFVPARTSCIGNKGLTPQRPSSGYKYREDRPTSSAIDYGNYSDREGSHEGYCWKHWNIAQNEEVRVPKSRAIQPK